MRYADRLPELFQFWAAEMARDQLRLGVYFSAVGLMLQLPGAHEYQYLNDDGELRQALVDYDCDNLYSVLAECFKRLGVEDVTRRVPGEENYEICDLKDKMKELLNEWTRRKHGLLNVVAECLDLLVVHPGLVEIAEDGERRWWQRWQPTDPTT